MPNLTNKKTQSMNRHFFVTSHHMRLHAISQLITSPHFTSSDNQAHFVHLTLQPTTRQQYHITAHYVTTTATPRKHRHNRPAPKRHHQTERLCDSKWLCDLANSTMMCGELTILQLRPTKYYKISLHTTWDCVLRITKNYSVLQNIIPYYKIPLRSTKVLLVTKILHDSTKSYSVQEGIPKHSTTPHCKVWYKYFCITKNLLRTRQHYTVIRTTTSHYKALYKVLFRITKSTKYFIVFYEVWLHTTEYKVLQSATPYQSVW